MAREFRWREMTLRLYRPLVAIVLGLALSYAACAMQPAMADERVLPAGTRVELPGGELLELAETHYLVSRQSLDGANAAADVNRRLTASLGRLATTTAQLTRPEPGWRVAARWALWGASIGAAFTAGLLLR